MSRSKPRSLKRKLLRLSVSIVAATISIILLANLFILPFYVSGQVYTIKPGYAFAERVSYIFHQPQVGDSIVYLPEDLKFFGVSYYGIILDNQTGSGKPFKLFYDSKFIYIDKSEIIGKIWYPSADPKKVNEYLHRLERFKTIGK